MGILVSGSMLGNLNEEIWSYIASFLDVKSVVSLSQTCQTMHAVMSDPLLQEKLIPEPEPLYHEGKWDELGFWIHSVEHRIKRLKEFESKSVSLESMQNVIKNLIVARDVLDDQSSIQAMNQVISKHEKELACKKQQFKFAKEKYKRLDSKKRNTGRMMCGLMPPTRRVKMVSGISKEELMCWISRGTLSMPRKESLVPMCVLSC